MSEAPKPRKPTPNQLIALNGTGCLMLCLPGTSEPVTFEQAWAALERAESIGVWTPKQKRKAA